MTDGFEHGGLDTGAVAHDAAIGPFHPGIAGGEIGLAQDDEAPFEAAFAGEALHERLGLVHQPVVHAHHQMRHAAQVLQGRARRVADGRQGLRVEGIAGDASRQGDGEGQGLLLTGRIPRVGLTDEAGRGEADAGEGVGHAGLGLGLGLGTAFLDAAGMGQRHGLGQGRRFLRRDGRTLARPEIGVEEEPAGVQ